jgi:hypothetical protein
MSSPVPVPSSSPPFPPGTEPKDAFVNITNLNPTLHLFLIALGLIHVPLFGKPCIVTSGKDGTHAPGSKHYIGNAIDLRIADKEGFAQSVFFGVLLVLSHEFKLAVFDESMLPGAGHVHIEIAG